MWVSRVPTPFVEKNIFALVTCIFISGFSQGIPAQSPPGSPNIPLIHGTVPGGKSPWRETLGLAAGALVGRGFSQAFAQGQGTRSHAGPGAWGWESVVLSAGRRRGD